MKLNRQEREAIEWLRDFSTSLLSGRAVGYVKPTIRQLSRMGIDIQFVSHHDVKDLMRGKDTPFYWRITDAHWYIRGKQSATYLPFQIKELKQPMFGKRPEEEEDQ